MHELRRGMVVTPHFLATRAGVAALGAGGNAVDAAVAANAMLSVVYCNACGLGGDAFALVWWAADNRLYGYNGSGRSPAALTPEVVRDAGHATMPTHGPLPITVPGAVDAWAQLVERFGNRPLRDAIRPAAEVADAGYALTAISARSIANALPTFDDAARAVFAPGDAVPSAGDTIRQPLLAASLRAVAQGGRDAYYAGAIAEEMSRAILEVGGVMTPDDLAAHRGDWVEPISTHYRGVDVATMPPNSQGITALIALNVLTDLDQRGWPGLPAAPSLPARARLDPHRLHAQVEALKVAWSERDRRVADPERDLGDWRELLSGEHAHRLAERLDPNAALRHLPRQPTGGGTVYLCAADRDGNMVSLIESNYMGFGSGIMGGRSGIMLQNRGAYFSLDTAHPNALAPRARTLHTLMPGMLLRDGRAEVALGAMGGDGQPQTMVQLVNALVDDGLDPQQAVERPRFVAEMESAGARLGSLRIEADGAGPELVEVLRARGHDVELVEPRTPLMGWAQVIRRDADGGYTGGADPRADSSAEGA